MAIHSKIVHIRVAGPDRSFIFFLSDSYRNHGSLIKAYPFYYIKNENIFITKILVGLINKN